VIGKSKATGEVSGRGSPPAEGLPSLGATDTREESVAPVLGAEWFEWCLGNGRTRGRTGFRAPRVSRVMLAELVAGGRGPWPFGRGLLLGGLLDDQSFGRQEHAGDGGGVLPPRRRVTLTGSMTPWGHQVTVLRRWQRCSRARPGRSRIFGDHDRTLLAPRSARSSGPARTAPFLTTVTPGRHVAGLTEVVEAVRRRARARRRPPTMMPSSIAARRSRRWRPQGGASFSLSSTSVAPAYAEGTHTAAGQLGQAASCSFFAVPVGVGRRRSRS